MPRPLPCIHYSALWASEIVAGQFCTREDSVVALLWMCDKCEVPCYQYATLKGTSVLITDLARGLWDHSLGT